MNPTLVAIPLLLLGAAVFRSSTRPFQTVNLAVGLSFLGAVLAGLAGAATDPVQAIMMVLVTGLAGFIARYSATYLRGDPVAPRYARWFLATTGAVSLLVAADHLAVLGVAWTGTSVALHQLLTIYPERAAAQVAAHKKFLLSRLADLSLLGGALLLWREVGDLHVGALRAAAAAGPLTGLAELGVVLVVVAVALKSAQLPFHGWLIQVMEAPTPVSALLHAGLVNIGGYLLLRLAPLLGAAPAALALLVVVGTLTAVIASLVRTTRVSVKVALAWSTCAQMGFLLLECGLGAWSLALLHLVGHSIYKAHAFLGSGSTVELWREDALGSRPGPVPLGASLGAALFLLMVVLLVPGGMWATSADPNTIGFATLGALALVPLFARASLVSRRAALGVAARGLAVAGLAVAWHLLLPAETAPVAGLWLVVIGGFAFLSVAQALLSADPRGGLARSVQPALFSGLYLDEAFTRLTFRIWPPSPVRA